MILVIAEKPSVAQTIAAVLGAKEKKDGFLTGSGYIVSWCVGHLVGLAEAATYGEQYKKWSYDSLPILPQEWKYTVASDKEKQFKTLKELMHRADVSEVVNACDAGREGELIFRFVYEMAGCKKPMRRLWISSMEDSAIKEGFSRLKNGEEYDALFASALCRAKADWLIGINATRLFSVLYNHTLNVGRVQTPTLKCLLTGTQRLPHLRKKILPCAPCLIRRGSCKRKLSDRSEADKLKAACEVSKAVCASLVKEKRPQPRRSSLTLLLYRGKQTACSVIPQSRPLTLHNLCMKKTSYLSENRQRISDRRHERHSGGHYQAALWEIFFYGGKRLHAGAWKGAEQ